MLKDTFHILKLVIGKDTFLDESIGISSLLKGE